MSGQASSFSSARDGGTVTATVEQENVDVATAPCLHLRLEPEERRVVSWTDNTIDNEHLNKKKSKCCCIYEKPKAWNESSSENESDDECDHCRGHVEKKRKNKKQTESPNDDKDAPSNCEHSDCAKPEL